MKQNRFVIRVLGLCMAGVSAVCSLLGTADAKEWDFNEGHVKVHGINDSVTVRGFFVNTTAWGGTGYNYTKCVASTGGTPSTGGTTTGSTQTAEDSLACAWYSCMGRNVTAMGDYYSVPGCSIGKCNGTGIYCTSSGFFDNYGYSRNMQSDGWETAPSYVEYSFIGCDTGWYITSTVAPCTGGQSSYTNMASCCKACPKFSFNTGNGQGITTENTSDSNCYGDWCWRAEGDSLGITSYRAYPADGKDKEYVDSNGNTYKIVATGCPYKN